MNKKIVVRTSFKDKQNFKEIPELRKGVIDQAPETPLMGNYAVNSIANFLHTPNQYLKVKRVVEISRDVRAYTLTPDASRGTAKLAYFKPGQNISISVKIGVSVYSRPFAICSSPLLSTDDEYIIIIKRKPDGFVSKFIFDTWTKGTQVNASSPFGGFTYQTLRDSKNIVAICDNTGFQPFLSMAEAIADGSLSINLTLLYSARKQNEVIMADRFNEIAAQSNSFRIIYVFSDEHILKCERGFVTKSLIEKYRPSARFSLFISCSPERSNNIIPQINDLRIERKYVRFNPICNIKKGNLYSDYPKELSGRLFLCKVIKNGEIIATVPCYSEETLLQSFEKEGLESDSKCRVGECGFCRATLIDGNIFMPQELDKRKKADAQHGIIHPCCTYPLSNLVIELQ